MRPVFCDFEDINVLLLHGAPYSFNDFLQRIGRSARKKDAAVITTLRKWSALDYFYFDKCRSMLSNQEKFIVDPPFTKDNEVILKNHILCSFFDYIASVPNTSNLEKISELKEEFGDGGSKFSESSKQLIVDYINSGLKIIRAEDTKILDEAIAEIERLIFAPSDIQNVDDMLKTLDEKYQINGLRTSDRVVEVEFQL